MPEIQGQHIIADDVIASIVMSAATEVKGLYLPSSVANFAERLAKKQSPKGIRVEQPEEGVIIDIKVVADYGINIPTAARELQEKVAGKVTELTGKNVVAVNVHVTDINMQSIPSVDKDPETD